MSKDSDLLPVKPITCHLKKKYYKPLQPLTYPLEALYYRSLEISFAAIPGLLEEMSPPTFADYRQEVLISSQMPLLRAIIATSVADETNKIKKFVQEKLEKQGTTLDRGIVALTVNKILLETESLKQNWRNVEDFTPGHSLDSKGRIMSREQDMVVKKDEDKPFMWPKRGAVVKSEQKVAVDASGLYSDSFKNNMANVFDPKPRAKTSMMAEGKEETVKAAEPIVLSQAAAVAKFKKQVEKAMESDTYATDPALLYQVVEQIVESRILVRTSMTAEEISEAADKFAKLIMTAEEISKAAGKFAKLMGPTAVQGKEEVGNSTEEEAAIDSTGKTAYYSTQEGTIDCTEELTTDSIEEKVPEEGTIESTEELTTESNEKEVPDSAPLSSLDDGFELDFLLSSRKRPRSWYG